MYLGKPGGGPFVPNRTESGPFVIMPGGSGYLYLGKLGGGPFVRNRTRSGPFVPGGGPFVPMQTRGTPSVPTQNQERAVCKVFLVEIFTFLKFEKTTFLIKSQFLES